MIPPSFECIRFCLEYTGYKLDDLDAIVFYDKPFLKFERLLETYYSFAPRASFLFSAQYLYGLKKSCSQKETFTKDWKA